MKLALYVVLLLGFCAGTVLAAPDGIQDEKPWSYPFNPRTVWPEDENVNNACPGQAIACGDVIDDAMITPAYDVDWCYFNVAVAGTWLTIGTDTPSMGGTMDTYLELYDVCGGTMIAYDDDGGPGLYSLISNFVTPHAGDYYVKVRAYSSGTGNYKVFVTCTEPVPPPENDTCAGAIPIERCTAGYLEDTSVYATNDYNPGTPGPSCTGYSANGKDVTYLLNLEAGDVCHFVYDTPEADAAFYIVTDCADVSGTCVVGSDQGDPEDIDWTCTVSGAYYLILDAYTTGWGGPWTLTYEITCPVQTYVCCVDQDCYLFETEAECDALGGVWHPEWTSCGPPDPCDYTPADPNSWGQIKNAYR